jgi:hypothetical protein
MLFAFIYQLTCSIVFFISYKLVVMCRDLMRSSFKFFDKNASGNVLYFHQEAYDSWLTVFKINHIISSYWCSLFTFNTMRFLLNCIDLYISPCPMPKLSILKGTCMIIHLLYLVTQTQWTQNKMETLHQKYD